MTPTPLTPDEVLERFIQNWPRASRIDHTILLSRLDVLNEIGLVVVDAETEFGPVSHRYGVRWLPTWPHISLGISIHVDRKYGHLTLHLPVGALVIGFVGNDQDVSR